VITGFNTDVEHAGVTYHVQTEDKGLGKSFILSLVYDGGTVLASKRQRYDDLLVAGFDEKVLAERLQRQHALMCAAIRAGRIEDLKRMTQRENGEPEIASASNRPKRRKREYSPEGKIPKPSISYDGIRKDVGQPVPMPRSKDLFAGSVHVSLPEPTVDVVSVIEVEPILPAEAVQIVSHMAGKERTSHNKLVIEMLGEPAFQGGEQRTVGFIVCRGSERKVVHNAEIMIKIIGTNIRPLIFHAVTDHNGIAMVDVTFPSFSAGRAAFLVRAMNEGEEVELRRSIKHG
jgi:hypothetical protein